MLVAASFCYAELVAVAGISFKMYLDDMLNNDLHQDSILAAIPSHPSSEVTNLLTCNLPPSDAIRSAVLAKIRQNEHFILLVNISGHHMDVKHQLSITMEQAKVEKLVVDLRSILHPVCSVPDDVLLEISL